ncbi:HAD-like protein [Panaeolus papilionaceus]|nr:HAD-like protein [Panaeolus papilionaceus]
MSSISLAFSGLYPWKLAAPLPCQNIIFDLGDVLFTWSPPTDSIISPKQLRAIFQSDIWYEYEKGNLDQSEAYQAIASKLSLSATDVAMAIETTRNSLRANYQMLQLIRDLKHDYGIRFYAMSNISAPDYVHLRERFSEGGFDLFEYIYTSSAVHERKPNLGFYHHVIKHSGVQPDRTIFVDDKAENVLSAISVGLRGIVFNNADEVSRRLLNYCGDPIQRALDWIENNKGLHSLLDIDGTPANENFSQMLAFEVCGRRDWVSFEEPERHFNFFKGGRGVGTTPDFPCDIDTTSIGLSITSHQSLETKHKLMDEILTQRTADGIVKTYFDSTRPRIDPIVCINALTLFYQYRRESELSATLDWVLDVFKNKAYTNGTYYYTTPECFLYFFSRLLDVAPNLRRTYGSLFREHCRERVGADGDAFSLALRIVIMNKEGETSGNDMEKLLELQDRDGGFKIGWGFKAPVAGILIGNRLLTTVLALKALKYKF